MICNDLQYGPADATATPIPSSLAPVKSRKSRMVYPVTQVVLEKRPLNGCSVVVVVNGYCSGFGHWSADCGVPYGLPHESGKGSGKDKAYGRFFLVGSDCL